MRSWIQKINLPDKRTIVIAVVVLVAALVLVGYLRSNSRNSAGFRSVPVKRGDLQAVISATGTVEPEEVVDIGAQVAGKIVAFGEDKNGKPVDYGSVVEAGTVLARIDDALYAADVDQAKATLGQSKAALQRSEADLGQLKAKLYQAQRDWARAQKLGPSDALSQADYDASQSAHETAKANVEVGKAAIAQAKQAVNQSQAALQRAQQNLSYCTIVSPVKGVIIDRRVNIGQTVVASLNAPSLFLLAKDLKRMQVWVSVNEADIGHIQPGQPVTFNIDAYPNEEFSGEVGKVRLNATMTQNVVTYTVEVVTDNSSGKLLPYLTANVKFIVGERQQVLMVPNAALRWSPQPEQIVKEFRGKAKKGQGAASQSRDKASPETARGEQKRGVVWVPQGALVRPVKVTPGLSDGSMTEVQSAELKEETPVVVGEMEKQENGKAAPGSSPFTPQLFRKPAGSSPQGR
ncbi:MAG TPA: efflux RND transporter periplasmic adaptor subunit [Desulfobaccales bacterium]